MQLKAAIMQKIKQFLPLYAVIILGFMGYALTIAIFIPMLMDKNFLLLPADTLSSTRATLSGLLLAMYPLGQFFGSPVIGNLSDHFGRKKVLVMSLFACLFGFIAMAVSITFHNIIFLFISSFFTGLCESNMAISQSIIADRAQDKLQKTKLIGYAYSACSLGYITGPLLGGTTGSLLGYSAPFWFIAFAVFLIAVWLLYSFNDTFIPKKQSSISLLKSLNAIKSIANKPSLYKLYAINFFIFFAIQGLYRVVPLYVVDEWQPTLHTYTFLISFVSFICFLANLFILGRLAKNFTTEKLLIGLLLAGSILVTLIIIPTHFNWIWLTYGLAVIPTVMALPTCTTLLSEAADANEQGQVLGNNQALLVLGEATSAAVGGIIAGIWIPLPTIIMGLILLITSFFIKTKKA